MTPQVSARVRVLGDDLAGLAVAARLALLGHAVTVVATAPLDEPWCAEPALHLPAAWRDLFTKSGRPLERELARAGLELVAEPPEPAEPAPGPRARAALAGLADQWQAVRRLGVEFALDAEAPPRDVAAAVGWPRPPRRPWARRPLRWPTSLADVVDTLPEPLAAQARAVARTHAVDPALAPGWLASRVGVQHTFGRWRVQAADGPRLVGALRTLLQRRLDERDVRVVEADGVSDESDEVDAVVVTDATLVADAALTERLGIVLPAIVETAWGPGPGWRGPATWRQLGTPRVVTAERVWRAGSLCRPGPEPWAQLLSSALAVYDLHAALTGEDVRPTNRTPPRRRPHRDPRRRRRTRAAETSYTAPSGPPTA